MRATEILFESRAAVLKAEAEAKLTVKEAAAELRRLHAENEALLETLRSIVAGGLYDFESAEEEARAALARTGEKT